MIAISRSHTPARVFCLEYRLMMSWLYHCQCRGTLKALHDALYKGPVVQFRESKDGTEDDTEPRSMVCFPMA